MDIRHPSLLKHLEHPKRSLSNYRFVASPINGINHWALMILVNPARKENEIAPRTTWTLLYFDSLRGAVLVYIAEKFARALLGLGKDDKLEVIKVPTLSQPNAVDCGLYPAHFLRTFLSDPGENLKHCLTVSRFATCDLKLTIYLVHWWTGHRIDESPMAIHSRKVSSIGGLEPVRLLSKILELTLVSLTNTLGGCLKQYFLGHDLLKRCRIVFYTNCNISKCLCIFVIYIFVKSSTK